MADFVDCGLGETERENESNDKCKTAKCCYKWKARRTEDIKYLIYETQAGHNHGNTETKAGLTYVMKDIVDKRMKGNEKINAVGSSNECNKKFEVENLLYNKSSKEKTSNECENLIIFDLSKNVVSKEVFDISIKIFLNYILQYCNSFKYISIDDNFNGCKELNGCNITINNCDRSNKCEEIIDLMDYNLMASSYFLNDSKQYNLFLNTTFSKIPPCEDYSILLLTNRIVDIDLNDALSCHKLTTILLQSNETNAIEDLQNIYENVTNAKAYSFKNPDCLNYLFYCILPCSSNKLECMKGDIDDCQQQSNYTPNANPENTLHIWYILDFINTTNYSFRTIRENVDYGLLLFIRNLDITKFWIKYISKFDGKVVGACNYNYSIENKDCHFEEHFIYPNLTGDINDDRGYLNDFLSHVPWSETLTETRIGILSIIILTNYATTSFITQRGNHTLQGQMYIYNPKSYEYYSTKLKNSTNLHFSPINESDFVFVYPIQNNIVSPTISSFITSRLPTNNTVETTSSSYTTKTVQDKPTSNILTILLICGTMCVFFIIFFIGVFIYCKRKRSNPDNVPFHRVSERTSQKDLVQKELGIIEPIVDKWELTWNKLVVQNVIGSGAYGQIMQGKLCKANGVKEDEIGVALKMPSKLATELEKKQFLNEVNLMKKISGNINIVQMHGCITDGDRICLVLELCQNLDLFKYVKKVNSDKSVSTKKDFFRFLWQISHGLQYLAEKSIVHRDLAARNILIDIQNNAKIADFGLSLQLIDSTFIIPDREREKLPIKWLAIESFKMYKFSLKTDVWTFGIVLYEMYSFGEIPYADIDASELLDYLEAGNRLNKPEFCPDEIFEIMLKCWIENPFKRPAIEEIITNFSLLVKCYGKDYENYICGTHFSSEM